MTTDTFQIRQLADELKPPESGKQNVVLADDENAKVVLFAFAAGGGLKEHIAPIPAIIQIIKGEAELTVGEDAVRESWERGFRWQPKRPTASSR
jgi:quercetin dioxygenase-like cupin family protein